MAVCTCQLSYGTPFETTQLRTNIILNMADTKTTKSIQEMSDQEIQEWIDKLGTIASNEVGGLTIQLMEEQERRKALQKEKEAAALKIQEKIAEERKANGVVMLEHVGKFYKKGNHYWRIDGIILGGVPRDILYQAHRAPEVLNMAIGFTTLAESNITLTRKEFEGAEEITEKEFYAEAAKRREEFYKHSFAEVCGNSPFWKALGLIP